MVESIPYHLDFDNISVGEAFIYAKDKEINENGKYSDKYAQVIINAGDNGAIAFKWANKFNTHLDEMAQIIINEKDFLHALEWTKFIKNKDQQMFDMVCDSFTADVEDHYCYVMSEWFQNGMFDKYNIKLNIIKNDSIDLFMDYLWINWADYSMDDFYSDLPRECQLGVMI